MPRSAQELLIRERYKNLSALRDRVAGESYHDDARAEAQTLLADIEQQLEVLNEEFAMREQYRVLSESLKPLADLEAFKKRYRKEVVFGPIPLEMYEEERKILAAIGPALKEAEQFGFKPSVPPSLKKDIDALKATLEATRTEFADHRKAQAELYKDGTDVADPCQPCMEKRFALILN